MKLCASKEGMLLKTMQTKSEEIDKIVEIPHSFLQYGKPRTVTTLQFQSLCMMAHMAFPNLRVICPALGQHFGNVFYVNGSIADENVFFEAKRKNIVLVLKAHAPRRFKLPTEIWLFATSAEEREWRDIAVEETAVHNAPVKFVQTMSELREKGFKLVKEYKDVFGFSSQQIDELMEYLRYWTILRQCCGCQMSHDRMLDIAETKGNRRWAHTDPLYPACEIYNITNLELQFASSVLYKRHGHRNRQLRTVSDLDGNLDGTYCQAFLKHYVETGNTNLVVETENNQRDRTCVKKHSIVTFKL